VKIYHDNLLLVLQGRVGAHKLGVVGNTIYVLLQISSGMLRPKIMKICSQTKVICKNKKGIFFETQCSFLILWYSFLVPCMHALLPTHVHCVIVD